MEKKTHVIIASLILSILVWLSVSMNDEYSVAIKVPFKVSHLPAKMALVNPVPRTVLVRVRGTGWQLASAYISTSTNINVDVSNFARDRIVLTSRDMGYSLDLGSSANVLSFTPDTVVIALGRMESRRVKVVPRIQVAPRKGFIVVGPPSVSPDSVTITGAARLVSRLDTWYTQRKLFRRVMNSINTNIPLSDTLSGIVSLNAQAVNVGVNVQQIAENTYRDIPIRIVNNVDSTDIILLPPTVDVTLRGGINTMSDITADSLSVTISYNRLIHSKFPHVKPVVKAPPTLQVISIEPDSVDFVIRK